MFVFSFFLIYCAKGWNLIKQGSSSFTEMCVMFKKAIQTNV